jgi:hypothetical protein
MLQSAVLGIVLALSAGPANIVGVVRDPHGLPVPGVRVDLTCRGTPPASTSTETNGEFAFSADEPDRCEVSVSGPGFAPARQRVRRDRLPMVLQLKLARFDQTVTVLPSASPAAGLGPALTSVTIGADELRSISNSTADLVRYATMVAGLSTSPAIYVDGLPAAVLPPAASVRQISVNSDRFSAEYADGDRGVVELVTTAPNRSFRFNPSGSLLGLGGRDAIDSSLESDSRSFGFDLGGGVPGLPFVMSMHLNAARYTREVPIEAALPSSFGAPGAAESEDRTGSGVVDAYYTRDSRINAHISVYQSWANGENVGVGGLTLPEAGFRSSSSNREIRATLGSSTSWLLYQGGFALNQRESAVGANSDAIGVILSGHFVAGGAGFLRNESTRDSWTTKHVLRTASPKPLAVGVMITREGERQLHQPNAAGTMMFGTMDEYNRAVAGENTATWLVARGNGMLRQDQTTLAAFIQKPLVRRHKFELTGGMRADHQSNVGTVWSPRLSAAAARGRFDLRAGGGLFVQGVPNRVFAQVRQNDGSHLVQLIARDVSLSTPLHSALEASLPIRSRFDRGLSSPREVMAHASIGRPFGPFVPVLEYTWARDTHLLGARRFPEDAGWVDVVDSWRAAARHRLHAQTRYMWKGQRFIAHYEWVHARDNTDGPFAHPERQDDIAREWARSAGTAAHNVTLMGRFRLPGEILANITESWHGSAPYDVTTGIDSARNGLYNDRGGRPRNSGNGPRYHSVNLYASRRMKLDRRDRMHLNLGVQIDNLLNARNYMSVGSVVGARTFGMPLAAFPGRSVRVRFSID